MWYMLLLTFICDYIMRGDGLWLYFMWFAFGSYVAGYNCGLTHPFFLSNILEPFRRLEGYDTHISYKLLLKSCFKL